MKPRLVHTATVTPYTFWADRDRRPYWQWVCCCGDLGSGHLTEDDAWEAAWDHETRNSVAHVATLDGTQRSTWDPDARQWRSVSAAAFLGVGVAGWVAAVVVVVVLVAMVALARAVKEGQAPVPDWHGHTIEPDPAFLWGQLSTDRVPPVAGDRVDVPGYTFVFDGDEWRRV